MAIHDSLSFFHEIIFIGPTIFKQISKKIDEVNALLDTAQAQALSNSQIRSKQLLSTKVHSATSSVLQSLFNRPTLYTERIDRKELSDLKTTYDQIPDLTRKLETCIQKTKGWRIATGQHINTFVLRFYYLLGADVPDMPDLQSLHASLASIFKIGKRKPKTSSSTTDTTKNGTQAES